MLSLLLAPRLPAMWGKATLAMLVSSTSMNAVSETATAMTQGLPLGRQIFLSRTSGYGITHRTLESASMKQR